MKISVAERKSLGNFPAHLLLSRLRLWCPASLLGTWAGAKSWVENWCFVSAAQPKLSFSWSSRVLMTQRTEEAELKSSERHRRQTGKKQSACVFVLMAFCHWTKWEVQSGFRSVIRIAGQQQASMKEGEMLMCAEMSVCTGRIFTPSALKSPSLSTTMGISAPLKRCFEELYLNKGNLLQVHLPKTSSLLC